MAKKKVFNIGNALTEGLEDTITAAHTYSGELRVDIIPLKKIEVDPTNPRDLLLTFNDLYYGLEETDADYQRKLDEKMSLMTLSHSIREQGIINPILVYKFGDVYRLIAGERRTLASILAGKTDIQAKILDAKPNDFKISLLQWIENIERSDLTLWERLQNLEKIVNAKKGQGNSITVTELSEILGCSKPHAMNYRAVLLADEQIKLLIQTNQIRNLEKAALLANIESTPLKALATEACLKGAPLKKLKVIADMKISQSSQPNRRGRQASAVQLGKTKNMNAAKALINAVLNDSTIPDLSHHTMNTDWNNFQSVSETFTRLLKNLEELYI